MQYFAHMSDGKPAQLLIDHLRNVSLLANEYAIPFAGDAWASISGLVHDIGKYQASFQKRLSGSNIHVEHATAGAQICLNQYGKPGRIIAAAIIGHHGGLPDGGTQADSEDDSTLCGRLKRTFDDYSTWRDELELPAQLPGLPVRLASRDEIGIFIYIFIKMLHSCLVDADFIDTESYFVEDCKSKRQQHPSVVDLRNRLERFRQGFLESKRGSKLNTWRTHVLESCLTAADEKPGFFRLTVPTGGGKTLSSLSFALKHATDNNMDRVIYAIPFTSIIEQNAAQFRCMVGDDAVLEHHSNFSWDDTNNEETLTHRLASENWDYPLIATTNVQLFDSIFAARPSQCRKIHHLANSVIILDEVQAFPDGYLQPALAALEMLVRYFHCTVVFCSATQPRLSDILPFKTPTKEIILEVEPLFNALRRVMIHNIGLQNDDALSTQIASYKQVLCIVNTRKHARHLFDLLSDDPGNFHLSALMCPAHRQQAIQDIRYRLENNMTCRVISTQLIEAGVDIDFPVIFRAMAGLDSIAQAAGRCNREGRNRREDSIVRIFTPSDAKLTGWFQKMASITEMIQDEYPDLLSPAAIESFFNYRFFVQGEKALDHYAILKGINENSHELLFPFSKIAADFHLIDDFSKTIIIPFDDKAKKLIDECANSRFPGQYHRKLQRYTVSVPPEQFNAYWMHGWLSSINDLFYILSYEGGYQQKTGLNTNVANLETLIF